MLAAEGKKGFYEGDIAKSIVNANNTEGGCLTLEDMKKHTSSFDEPISTVYRGIKIWEMPPNGQGLVALLGLNILEGFNLKDGIQFLILKNLSSSCCHQICCCFK